MALTGHPFPYDIDTLLGGAVRILYAPADDSADDPGVPSNMADVFEMESNYEAVEPWVDLGATRDSFSYARSFDSEGWEIQQTQGNVIEEITDLSRTFTVSVAALDPERFQLLENAPNIQSVAAAAGQSAQEKVAFGSYNSVERYRFAFVSQRSRQSGTVEESTGTPRGRFVMGVAYTAQIAADEVEFEQGKGELSAFGLQFTLFPQPGEPTGEEWGAWYFEEAGTIAGP